MLEVAKTVLKNAYAPYSHFQVGCCIKTEKGTFFSGCNIENASYGLTLCAEASAIAAMVTAGENKIKEIVVISSGEEICTPCGACRQRLFEFSTPNTQIYMYSASDKKLEAKLFDLLPHTFSANHLEKK